MAYADWYKDYEEVTKGMNEKNRACLLFQNMGNLLNREMIEKLFPDIPLKK